MSRTPFARSHEDLGDYIGSVPEGNYVDENSPLSTVEVHFDDDESARRKSTHLDWHNNAGEQELELVAGFNAISREDLNQSLAEIQAVHGPVKTLAITMAIQNARSHALFFLQNGFKRVADRSRNTWTHLCDLDEHRAKKRGRPKRHVDVKKDEPEPKPEQLEFKMSATEYADAEQRRADLLAEIERLQTLKDEHVGRDIT